jgi:hypothetical protein
MDYWKQTLDWGRKRLCEIIAVLRVGDGIPVLTFILALMAYLQWETFVKTDQTLKAQQRAWLAPRDIVIPEDLKKDYDEVIFKVENTGKEPATKIAYALGVVAIKQSDFADNTIIRKHINDILKGRNCDTIQPKTDGGTIYPGQEGLALPFREAEIAKFNAGEHYVLVAGCLIYETIRERHQSNICVIREPIIYNRGWRSTGCRIHTEAN